MKSISKSSELALGLEIVWVKIFLVVVCFLTGLLYGVVAFLKIEKYLSVRPFAVSLGTLISFSVIFLLLRWFFEGSTKNAD